MRYFCASLFLTSLLFAEAGVARAAEAEGHNVGETIEDFSLHDYRGKVHALHDYRDSKLLVVAFLGNDCPLARLYGPRLEQLSKQLGPQGIAFVGVNSNLQDRPTSIAAYANKHGVSFPILKDARNVVADAFAAERTPEVFLLDENRVIRYRGRVDDQYIVGLRRKAAERNDLAIAVEELLSGKQVSQPYTEALGCHIGRVRKIAPHGDITYAKHVSRILNRRCVECHRAGELGPFPLTTYDEVLGWGDMISEVIDEGRMPPWFADPKYGHFSNNSQMTDDEKTLVHTWVKNGCPEGDRTDLPEAAEFITGWRIGEPDAVYEMPNEFTVPAEGTVDYQNFLIDPELKEDVWVSMAEAHPGNPEVVHHIVLYAIPAEARESVKTLVNDSEQQDRDESDSPAVTQRPLNQTKDSINADKPSGNRKRLNQNAFRQMVAIYAPGMPPWKYPQGSAMKVKKGSLFIVQMHYTPNGTQQTDRSYVGFKFARTENVKKRIQYGMASNNQFEIPPYSDSHQDTSHVTFRENTLLLNLFPHMHYRGKAFRVEAVYPNRTREVLLNVPRYDFNWQLRYDLAEPKLLPEGTMLLCTAVFDNSEKNPLNPDPSQTVGFGLQSWNEMLVGYYTCVSADEDLSEKKVESGESAADSAIN